MILSNKSNFNKKTDLLLYLAARSENIEKIIKKNYKKKIILIDRFTDSTLAYQHYGMGLNKDIINKLNTYLINNIKPNKVFLSLVNKKNLIHRLNKRKIKNRYDKFSKRFYINVQKAFINIAKKNKRKYFVLDNSKDTKETENIILKKTTKLLGA